jgi:hypothetical protein
MQQLQPPRFDGQRKSDKPAEVDNKEEKQAPLPDSQQPVDPSKTVQNQDREFYNMYHQTKLDEQYNKTFFNSLIQNQQQQKKASDFKPQLSEQQKNQQVSPSLLTIALNKAQKEQRKQLQAESKSDGDNDYSDSESISEHSE